MLIHHYSSQICAKKWRIPNGEPLLLSNFLKLKIQSHFQLLSCTQSQPVELLIFSKISTGQEIGCL